MEIASRGPSHPGIKFLSGWSFAFLTSFQAVLPLLLLLLAEAPRWQSFQDQRRKGACPLERTGGFQRWMGSWVMPSFSICRREAFWVEWVAWKLAKKERERETSGLERMGCLHGVLVKHWSKLTAMNQGRRQRQGAPEGTVRSKRSRVQTNLCRNNEQEMATDLTIPGLERERSNWFWGFKE